MPSRPKNDNRPWLPLNNITATAALMIRQAECEILRGLLARLLKLAATGKWRDKANLSIEAHPIWDEVRAELAENQPPNRSVSHDASKAR